MAEPPHKKIKLESSQPPPDYDGILRGILQTTDITTRAKLVQSHPPKTLRHLSQLLRHQFRDSDREFKAVDVLECLNFTVRSLCTSRVAESDTPELLKHKQESKAVVSLLVKNICKEDESSMLAANLRVLAVILKPPNDIKVRNPAYASNDMLAFVEFLVGKEPAIVKMGFPKLITCLRISACRYHASRCLVALVKTLPRAFAEALADRDLSPLVEGVEVVGNPNHILVDVDVHIAAFIAYLLEKGHWSIFSICISKLLSAFLSALCSILSTPSSVPVLNDAKKKFLKNALTSIYVLCKRQELLTVDLQIPLRRALAKALIALTMVITTSADLNLAQTVLQTVLFTLRRQRPSSADQMAGGDADILVGLVPFMRFLGRLADRRVKLLHPAIIQPVLDTLLLELPRNPISCDAAIDAGIVEVLLHWCVLMFQAPTPLDPKKSIDWTKLKSKCLKILTFIAGKDNGMDAFAHIEMESFLPFQQLVGSTIRTMLLGEDNLMEHSTSESELGESANDHPGKDKDSQPALGIRCLRIVSLLLKNKVCRTRFSDNGLLADLIDQKYLEVLFMPNAPTKPIVDGFSNLLLLLSVLGELAKTSNIRFNMRDGVFLVEHASDDKHVSDSDTEVPATTKIATANVAIRRTSSFTLIHFLLALIIFPVADFYRRWNPSETHSVKTKLPATDPELAVIVQRAMLLLGEYFAHDVSVTDVLCACPASTFGPLTEHIPKKWLHAKKTGETVISVLDVILTIVRHRVYPLDVVLALETDASDTEISQAPDHSIICSLYEPSTNFLSTLMNTEASRDQLLKSDILRLLSEAGVSYQTHSLVQTLVRLLTAEQSLERLIFDFGISAIMEPLLENSDLLILFRRKMLPYKDAAVAHLTNFRDYYASDPGMYRRCMIGLGWWMGEDVVSVARHEPSYSHQSGKRMLQLLLGMALGRSSSDKPAMESKIEETSTLNSEKMRAVGVCKYLAWTVHLKGSIYTPFEDALGGIPVDEECTRDLQSALKMGDILAQSTTVPDDLHSNTDLVSFRLSDGDSEYVIRAPRGPIAALSDPLHTLLYGEYREAQENVVTIRDVTRPVWTLLVFYALSVDPNTTLTPGGHTTTTCCPETLEVLFEAHALADRFLITSLKTACAELCIMWCIQAAREGDVASLAWAWRRIHHLDDAEDGHVMNSSADCFLFGQSEEEEGRKADHVEERFRQAVLWGLACCMSKLTGRE
ncbi:hypothetical protein DFS34DRAFT_595638 [Phlyctochytrium arcticum]|nr:hypothetical protein DFS34DRAFT_595638 [Phlyctochytrium arcticum]